MAIRSRDNLYNGVNAHLHSQFQRQQSLPSWPAFHGDYIFALVHMLNKRLPQHYRAVGEQSLQIIFQEHQRSTRIPDITLYKQDVSTETIAHPQTKTATWTAPIERTLSPQGKIFAVVIYDTDVEAHPYFGKPVTRIEILSPTNKAGGSYYRNYLDNRAEALMTGFPLVEVDYLYQTRSPILTLPEYPTDDNSFPYSITISDPRITDEARQVQSFGFYVDDPIPDLTIPLTGDETVEADFRTPYNETFEGGRWGDSIDYSLPPENLDSYAPIDQQRIIARMHAVAELAKQSEDNS